MSEATVQSLMEKVKNFCEEREWDQFHNPKDLAIGISTEANEILDIIRFQSEQQMNHMDLNEILMKKLEQNEKNIRLTR